MTKGGVFDLSWYEMAYAVGGGLKVVHVYDALPLFGCATGLLSGALLLTKLRDRRHVLFAHQTLPLAVSLLGLLVLLWRFFRGMPDPWRIATTLAFICAWILYFRRTGKRFRRPPSPRRRDRTERSEPALVTGAQAFLM
jgi:hypothetical protein